MITKTKADVARKGSMITKTMVIKSGYVALYSAYDGGNVLEYISGGGTIYQGDYTYGICLTDVEYTPYRQQQPIEEAETFFTLTKFNAAKGRENIERKIDHLIWSCYHVHGYRSGGNWCLPYHLTHLMIAEALGIRRVTVTKRFSELRELGYVEGDKRSPFAVTPLGQKHLESIIDILS